MNIVGKVVSTKMNKTAVVKIERLVTHPLYKKRIKKVKKFKAHDELGVKVGDKVLISTSKPISKDKHFVVKEILTK